MIFDTHAHYDDDAFNEDRIELLGNLEKNGISRVVNVGSGLQSCQMTLQLMEQYPFLYGALGIHPSETASLDEDSFLWLKEQCRHEKCVAIGEIGLDYYWPEPDRDIQKKWFIRQLEVARELNLPVVIHSRDAAMDTMDIMKQQHAEEIGGVIHCFSYSQEVADFFLNMGFYIGIGGVVTFKNAKKLKEVVIHTPIERILVETDCPYLAPEPNRGKRNSSLNLPYILEKIAELKQLDVKEVEEITWKNAQKILQKY